MAKLHQILLRFCKNLCDPKSKLVIFESLKFFVWLGQNRIWMKFVAFKRSLMICRYITKSFIEIPSWAKKAIFITEFVIWCKNPPCYEVKMIFQWLCAWRNFEITFSRPLFVIIFRVKISLSGLYSILTGHTKVESVAY